MILLFTVFFQVTNKRMAKGKVLWILIEKKLAAIENSFCRSQIVKKDEAAYERLSVFVGFWVNVGQPLFATYDFELSQVISRLLKF